MATSKPLQRIWGGLESSSSTVRLATPLVNERLYRKVLLLSCDLRLL